MKKTKIVTSIGPSSCSVEVFKKMVEAGANVARINFSHATLEERVNVVNTVKEVRKLTNKNIGILYAVTDGFKNIDKVVKTNVKKEVRKNLRNLEHVINNSSIQSDGSLSYMSGVNTDDNNSYIGKGIQLDI